MYTRIMVELKQSVDRLELVRDDLLEDVDRETVEGSIVHGAPQELREGIAALNRTIRKIAAHVQVHQRS